MLSVVFKEGEGVICGVQGGRRVGGGVPVYGGEGGGRYDVDMTTGRWSARTVH